jgi:hypothetical protein
LFFKSALFRLRSFLLCPRPPSASGHEPGQGERKNSPTSRRLALHSHRRFEARFFQAEAMTAKKEGTIRFLVTVTGIDNWQPEVRGWVDYPAGTTTAQVLAEYRKKYPLPFQVVIMPERPKTSGMG